jgi:Protein of unknown function (DUF998)
MQKEISVVSAHLSLWAAALFLVLVAALHIIKPEFDPTWRFISEYAIGRHGWVMVLAFFSLAFSCVTSFFAIRSLITTTGGRVGLALLLVSAVSLVMGGIFVTDPITASKSELTTHGNLHGLAATIGIPGLSIAAVLISRSLVRNLNQSPMRRSLLWTSRFTWIFLVLMYVTMIAMLTQNQGKFGPNVLIGWPNRLLVVAYCAWLIAIAWSALQLARPGRVTRSSTQPQLLRLS